MGNTYSIPPFSELWIGTKILPETSCRIVRCCLRFYHLFTYIPCAPWFSCMLVLKLFWLEIGHISFDIIVSLHNGSNVLRWMPHSSRVYLKTVNTPKQRVFPPAVHHFPLQYTKYSRGKMASSGEKSLAVGHIADFQIDPSWNSAQREEYYFRAVE